MSENPVEDKIKNLQIDNSRKSYQSLRKSKKKYILPVIIGLIILVGYWGTKLIPPEVEVAKVVKISPPKLGEPILTVSGYVIPDHKIELAPKLIGRVKWIGVEKGDTVKKGQEIVRIEDREFQAQVDQSKARLAGAKARLTELKTGARKEEINIADANLKQAETNFINNRTQYRRIEKLYLEGAVSRERFDNASTEFAIAKSALDSANENYDMVKTGPRKEIIQAAEAEVRAAEANLDFAESQLADTLIRAPADGTILERLIEVGEMVTNTSYGGTRGARVALLSMADLNDLEVEIDLNESDLNRIKMNQPAQISLEAYPDHLYQGKLAEIAPEANRQKATVQLKVRILDPDVKIKPEMNAKVSFLNDISPDQKDQTTRIYVPLNAFLTEGEQNYLLIVNHNRVKKVPVRKVRDSEFGIEVNGLTGDEIIVVRGKESVKDGSLIRIKKS